MRSESFIFLWACALAVLSSALDTAQSLVTETCARATKTVITSEDELPRRSYQLSRLPSELLDALRSELDPLADALDIILAIDLASFDIQRQAMRAEMLRGRAEIAIHRGHLRAAQGFIRQVRAEQEKPADELAYSVFLEAVLELGAWNSCVGHRAARQSVRACHGCCPALQQ